MFELVDVNLEKRMDNVLHFVAKNLRETGHNPKPVLLHCFKVSMTLYELGYSEDIIIASILHDLIEDTDITYEDIANEYGEKIADIVASVSFNPKIDDKLEQAREMFKKCHENGFDALIVKCSDLLDNINFVNLVDDEKMRIKLSSKYSLFLEMSKDIIGKEKIYRMLSKKVKLLIGEK